MQTESQMWTWTLNMALATYLSKKPNRQVQVMAKRYGKSTADPVNKRILRSIRKSPEPALLVRLSYEQLICESFL